MAEETPAREGWQAEGALSQRKWHFIRGNTSLCGKFGFYFGEVMEGGLKPGGEGDCAECKRRVEREIAKQNKRGAR